MPPFLLYCLAMGAVVVPKLNVILELICHQYHSKDSLPPPSGPGTGDSLQQCQTSAVQSHVAGFMLCANLLSGVLCAFTSPRLGALSDRYGRKVILAFTATGMLLGDIITIAAATFPDAIPAHWILLEFAIGGLAGSFVATMAVAQSYAADCTPPAHRSTVFGQLHGCMYIGSAVGPLLGGLFIRYIAAGYILSIFFVAFFCHAAFIAFVLFFLPESLTIEQQLAARVSPRKTTLDVVQAENHWMSAMRLRSWNVLSPLFILRPPAISQDARIIRRNLVLLSAIDTVVFGMALGSTALLVLYSEYTFSWSNFESSVFVSIANTSRVITLVLILPLVSYCCRMFGPSASRVNGNFLMIRLALLFDIWGYVSFAMSTNPLHFKLSTIPASLGAVASPVIQATLTTHVSADRTGELLGALSLLHALARMSLPAILHLIYMSTVGSATIFWCLAGTFGVAALASLGARPRPRTPV